MIWHPLTWSFWAVTLTGVVVYTLAAVRAADVLAGWSPDRADSDQLRRERHAEQAMLLGRWSLVCLATAAGVGLAGIALFWHRIIPGAMCGTGVLQAMGIPGRRAMIFWALFLFALYLWLVLDQLNRDDPTGVLTPTSARTLLSAAPLLVLGLVHAWLALMRVDTIPAVSCCAMIYDQVLQDAAAPDHRWLTPAAVWISLASGVVLAVLAGSKIRAAHRGWGGWPAVAALIWAMTSLSAVTHTWSAYYYQVLAHPCPWCLFLPDYGGVGIAVYGAMVVVVLEGAALWLADRVRANHPNLAPSAVNRLRRAAWCIIGSLLGFTLLTAGPALLWRLRTGVWLHG